MGGLGSKMRRRTLVASTLLGTTLLVVLAAGALAGGLGFGPLVYTIDVSETFAKVPSAAEAAFDALDGVFADFGVPPEDRAEIRAGFEEGLAEVGEALGRVPTLLPVPLLGGSFEISLPLIVVDGVRFSVGFLSDGLMRGIADLVGFPIPSPLVDLEIDESGVQGALEADLTFRSWSVATELTKRLELLVAALNLGIGVGWVGGEAAASIEFSVPPELVDGIMDALDALHLDGFTWSAFSLHASIGIEIGPPFLRVGVELRLALPVSASSGWWDVRVGKIGGSLGMAIRF